MNRAEYRDLRNHIQTLHALMECMTRNLDHMQDRLDSIAEDTGLAPQTLLPLSAPRSASGASQPRVPYMAPPAHQPEVPHVALAQEPRS